MHLSACEKAHFRRIAAVVHFLVELVNFAFPVNVGYYLPAGFNAWQVFLSARAVLIEEKTRRACLFDLFEHLRQLSGAVEEQNKNGYIYKC